MTPPSAFRYEYVGSGDDRKTITHANKNEVMNYPNRENAELYDVSDYYEYVVDSPKKAFIADSKEDLQYHVTEKELAERLANGEWVVVATWFNKNQRERNLEIYRDLWEIEDTISDREEKLSMKRRKGYLGSYWGNVYNEPRVKPMPSLSAIIVSPQLLNAAYYDSYSHPFRDTTEYDKHLELVGQKELSAEEFGADSFQDDTHFVLIHGEKDGETVSKGHQLGITERDGFTPTTITTFDYNPKAGLGTSRLLNFDGRVETIDPNFVNRHHRSQRFRGEEVADRNEGQVVNITNVGDRVFVTVRHHYYDDFDNPILDDRAMRPYEIVYEGSMEDVMLNDYTPDPFIVKRKLPFDGTYYDFRQIDKILQDMDEDDSIQLTNTDGSEVRNKALNIYENIRTVQDSIKQLKEENAETFRIDALENYLLRLKYDLDDELNRWAWENMNAEEFGADGVVWNVSYTEKGLNEDILTSVDYETKEEAEDLIKSVQMRNRRLRAKDWIHPVMAEKKKQPKYAEEFEATKGIDTYSQPFEEMKIGSTTKKVATFIAAMIGGGAIYSHFTKRSE